MFLKMLRKLTHDLCVGSIACFLLCGSGCKKEEPAPPDPDAVKRELKLQQELREKERQNIRQGSGS
jgi:hypothetical protein